jgi:hypothetical protein
MDVETEEPEMTDAPTMAMTDDEDVAAPIDGPCDGLCSDSYDTLDKVQLAIDMIETKGTICLCPTTFAPEAGNCPLFEENKPSLVVEDGQDVTIECVSPLGAKCIFACPNTVIQVASGGVLTFMGGNNTLMTGGALYSRVYVDLGGMADISGVEFSK